MTFLSYRIYKHLHNSLKLINFIRLPIKLARILSHNSGKNSINVGPLQKLSHSFLASIAVYMENPSPARLEVGMRTLE